MVTIDRPQQLNAIDRLVLRQLDAALDRIEADDEIRAFVLSGAGTPDARARITAFVQKRSAPSG